MSKVITRCGWDDSIRGTQISHECLKNRAREIHFTSALTNQVSFDSLYLSLHQGFPTILELHYTDLPLRAESTRNLANTTAHSKYLFLNVAKIHL